MAGMLLFDSIALQWVSAAVCLIGVVLLIIYYQHMYNILLKQYLKNKDLLNKTT